MDLDRCMKRIGYSGARTPNIDVLRDLQLAFLIHVPFENLDIHLGRKIVLSPEGIFEKIVSKRRGGFCYECNILFSRLLTAIGFQVAYLSARMLNGDEVNPEFDHMVLQVHLDEDYLVDVGNGQSAREPLRIDGSNVVASEGRMYRVGARDEVHALYVGQTQAAWTPRYLFTLTPREAAEFEGMCRYHQTSPDSPFAKHQVATIATGDGRVTLRDMHLSTTRGDETEDCELATDLERTDALKRYFGIEITGQV